MIYRLRLVVLLLALLNTVHAAPPPELIALQQQYEFLVAERVTTPFGTGMEALNAKFLIALNNAGEEAKKAGKLPEALAIEEDKKLISSKQPLPEQDDETTPASLGKLHAVYRLESAKLAQQRTAAHAALLPPYAAKLKELESTLTKGDRLAEAKEVMQYREGLGLGTAVVPTMVGNEFTNSLGMKFVSVPGTKVSFCIHETRKADYAAYAAENSGVDGSWKNQSKDGFPAGADDTHPVVGVCWADAKMFCEWVSKKEGQTYRLPTDREWSYAVGIARSEKKDSTPDSLNGKITDEFAWGSKWPPTKSAGNFADTAYKKKFPAAECIENYTDGFISTSPVMSFQPNKLGLYDMAGNVWEWCDDWYSPAKVDRVSRGGSWTSRTQGSLLSSSRDHTPPSRRDASFGFRVVLEQKAP